MKPTVQNIRPVRRGDSQRQLGHSINNTPATDWSFQATAGDLRGHGSFHPGTTNHAAAFRSLSQGFFDAESKRSYRAEAGAFIGLLALTVWPLAQAVQAAFTLLK